MKRSTQRILTTHTGSLPRPTDVVELLLHEQKLPGAEAAKLKDAVRRAVAEVVAKQVACGLDVINDGEQGRTDYTTHVKDRLSGFDGPSSPPLGTGEPDFPELSAMLAYFASPFQHRPACSARSSGRTLPRSRPTSRWRRRRPRVAEPLTSSSRHRRRARSRATSRISITRARKPISTPSPT